MSEDLVPNESFVPDFDEQASVQAVGFAAQSHSNRIRQRQMTACCASPLFTSIHQSTGLISSNILSRKLLKNSEILITIQKFKFRNLNKNSEIKI